MVGHLPIFSYLRLSIRLLLSFTGQVLPALFLLRGIDECVSHSNCQETLRDSNKSNNVALDVFITSGRRDRRKGTAMTGRRYYCILSKIFKAFLLPRKHTVNVNVLLIG